MRIEETFVWLLLVLAAAIAIRNNLPAVTFR
jgi:hypothetical protein